jgi:hypothetical protein
MQGCSEEFKGKKLQSVLDNVKNNFQKLENFHKSYQKYKSIELIWIELYRIKKK